MLSATLIFLFAGNADVPDSRISRTDSPYSARPILRLESLRFWILGKGLLAKSGDALSLLEQSQLAHLAVGVWDELYPVVFRSGHHERCFRNRG